MLRYLIRSLAFAHSKALMGEKKLLCTAHSFKEKLDLLGESPNLKIYLWINNRGVNTGGLLAGEANSSAVVHFLPN